MVLATNGYPEKYQKGSKIKIDESKLEQEVTILHASTAIDEGGNLTANGGRVLNVVASAKNFGEARNKAYEAINAINWSDCYYRKDIAKKAENF